MSIDSNKDIESLCEWVNLPPYVTKVSMCSNKVARCFLMLPGMRGGALVYLRMVFEPDRFAYYS